MLKQKWDKLLHWHIAHKGESACHFCYLAFTFVEAHGMHAMFAGGVAVFVVLGVVLRGGEE